MGGRPGPASVSRTLVRSALLAIPIAYVGTGSHPLYAEHQPTRLDSPAHRDEYRTRLGPEQPA